MMRAILREIFSAEDGRLSSTRIAFVSTTFMVMITWTYVCVRNLDVVDIPTGVAGVIFSFMAGKVGQSWIERGK